MLAFDPKRTLGFHGRSRLVERPLSTLSGHSTTRSSIARDGSAILAGGGGRPADYENARGRDAWLTITATSRGSRIILEFDQCTRRAAGGTFRVCARSGPSFWIAQVRFLPSTSFGQKMIELPFRARVCFFPAFTATASIFGSGKDTFISNSTKPTPYYIKPNEARPCECPPPTHTRLDPDAEVVAELVTTIESAALSRPMSSWVCSCVRSHLELLRASG